MKRVLFRTIIFLGLVVIGTISTNNVVKKGDNSIEKVEVFKNGKISSQVDLFLSYACDSPVVRDYKEMPGYTVISVFFPDVGLSNKVDGKQVFLELNNLDLVKHLGIDLSKKKVKVGSVTKEKRGVLLSLIFYHEKAFVKFIGLDHRRFRLEIFSKKELDRISKSVDGPLLLALNTNSVLPSGSSTAKKKNKQDYRIVIDAGHGGDCEGARSNGLVEKDITLDIAIKAKKFLEKEGFKAFLTRNSDVEVPLLDRSRMAEELKCDLFVSIHANSSVSLANAKGIETYYGNVIDDGGFEFLFANDDKGYKPGDVTTTLNRIKTSLSSNLAKNIQISLLDLLYKNNVRVVDRGVKKQSFLVLVRGGFPSVLVEVGFITNKEEARLLENEKYRTLISYGIVQGLKNFWKQ